MRKSILQSVSTILTLALLFSIITCAPFSISAAETDDPVAAAADSGKPFGDPLGDRYVLDSSTYLLTADFAAQGYLYVPIGVTAVIDLNGYTIDRGLSAAGRAVDNGSVIRNDGTLTIKDSSADGTGTLTGGFAHRGGAVYNIGTLTIEGGNLYNNRAGIEGGAVFSNATSTLNISGGKFTNNAALQYGGGAVINNGTMNLSGGVFSGNYAEINGGAIWNGNSGVLNFTGGTITGNYAKDNGSGVYQRADGTLTISGSPIIRDNAKSNLYLNASSVINVNGALSADARIDVKAENMPRAVTNGLGGGSASVFSFVNGAVQAKVENGEIVSDITATTVLSSGDYTDLINAVSSAADGDVIALSADFVNNNDSSDRLIIVENKAITVDLRGHTIDRARTSTHNDGHVFWVKSGSLTLLDSCGSGVIKGGYATRGGAVNVAAQATLNLYNVTLAGNNAGIGGAVYNIGALFIDGAEIRDNTTTDDGAIYIGESATSAVIKNAVIRNNTCEGNDNNNGGAVHHNASITATIENTLIRNHSADVGGAVYMNNGSVNMTDCMVAANEAGDGGAVYVNNASGSTFTATNTVFTGNSTTVYSGGAITNYGETVLNGCILSGNNSHANGGAVWTYSKLTAENTLFENNTATSQDDSKGGAIYVNSGVAEVSGCTLTDNTANDGGAVYVKADNTPVFTATDSVFTGNESTIYGGGAITNFGNTTIDGCTITGNKASNSSGIYTNPSITMKGKTVITDNIGNYNVYIYNNDGVIIDAGLTEGSQIGFGARTYDRVLATGLSSEAAINYFTPDETGSSVDIVKTAVKAQSDPPSYNMVASKVEKVTVDSWTALQNAVSNASYARVITLGGNITASGGNDRIRIYNGKNIVLDLNGKTLNRARGSKDRDGHVIEVHGGGVLTVRDSSSEQTGKITGGWANNGGGININDGGKLTLESGSVSGNKADNGGGVIVKKGASFTMTGGSIDGNTASDGGGVKVDDDSAVFNMSGGAITNNTAEKSGGGIFTDYKLTVTGGTINKNKAKYGGGIYYDDNRISITVNNAVIRENSASEQGSAIYLQAGTINMEGCTIDKNTSGDGTVYVTSSTTFRATGTTINDNKVTAHAGGAFVNKGSLTLTSCTINSNSARNNGGAIWNSGTTTINDCSFTNNKANNGKGGAIVISEGKLNLNGATITGNMATNGGSGICLTSDGAMNMKGHVVITDNAGTGLYIASGKKVTITGQLLDGTFIDVYTESETATFTTGYKTYHDGEDPAIYFNPEEGCSIIPDDNGEAKVVPSDWSFLQKLIDATENGGTLTLDKNWKAASGDTTVLIRAGKTITLNLNGFTIDGNKSIFTVIDVNGTLIVKDSSAEKKGTITGSKGGTGIYVASGASCTFESGNITGNNANNGGGMSNRGTLTVTGGVISGNKAGNGGGIYNEGALQINGGTISGNTASDNGGGIYNTGTGTVTITDGAVTGNKANKNGGGIWNRGTINMEGGAVSDNAAVKEGGGIYLDSENPSVLNVGKEPVVENNKATIGSNILLSSGKVITLTSSLYPTAKLDVVTKNTSLPLTSGYSSHLVQGILTYNGKVGATEEKNGELYMRQVTGDIYVSNWDQLSNACDTASSGKVIVLTSDAVCNGGGRLGVYDKSITIELNGHKIDRNRSSGTGNGQVFGVSGATLTLTDAAGTGVITGGRSHDGGGIFIGEHGTVIANGVAIQGNTADDGGGDGGAVFNRGNFFMDGGSLSFNTADDTGGAIYSKSTGTVRLNNVIITGNYADDDDGGAMNLHLKDNSSYIKNCYITNNRCGDNHGGAIRMDAEGKTLTIENTHIEGNKASENGGGIMLTSGSLVISDSFINNNTAENGGGIALNPETELKATNTEFNGNEATKGSGGGIAASGAVVELTDCCINDNTAKDGGGGLLLSIGYAAITGTEIHNNTVLDGMGGGIAIYLAYVKLKDSSVIGNQTVKSGNYGGGGIATSSLTGNFKALDCINVVFEDNFAGSTGTDKKEECGGGVYVGEFISASFTDCVFKGNRAKYDGGGIEVRKYAEARIENTSFTENECIQCGSAIDVKDHGKIYLKDVTVSDSVGNHAVWVDEDLHVSGKIEIHDNDGVDVYLNDEEPIVLDGKLSSGSLIGVQLQDDTGTFTQSFNKYHPSEDPSVYFFANEEGYSVHRSFGGEGIVVSTDWIELQRILDAAENGATVQLTKDYKANESDNSLVIARGKNITLDLNGYTIDGNKKIYTVIDVHGALTVKDSSPAQSGTITGSNNEAGITVAANAAVTFESGNITGNESYFGGGVYNRGTLTVTGGNISGNNASYNGGGIYNDGKLYLYGGRIENNTAVTGGGIFCTAGSQLHVKDAPYVKGNSGGSGKNILLDKGAVVTVDALLGSGAKLDIAARDFEHALTSGFGASGSSASVFSYNENDSITLKLADGELYFPYAVTADIWVGTWEALQNAINNTNNRGKVIGLEADLTPSGQRRITVDDGRVITLELAGHTMNRGRTSKTDQGNVFKVDGSNTHFTLRDTLETGVITGGFTKGDGGGFYVVGGSKLTVQSGNISGNRCSSDGAGIYVGNAELVMTGGAVSNNVSADNGAGIYTSSGARMSLSNAQIIYNTSENGGGGLNVHLKADATIENCNISYNKTQDSDGAGLSIDSSDRTLTLINTKITHNTADDEGGGIYIDGGTIVMDGGVIDSNVSDDGGGVYISGSDTLRLRNNTVISNNRTTGESGGGITCHGYLDIDGATVEYNQAHKNGGGVFYQNSGKTVTLKNAVLRYNKADEAGGGLYIKQGTVKLVGGEITGNTSYDGGGVYVKDKTDFYATDVTIRGNQVLRDGGGGITNDGETTLTNVIIEENRCKTNGGGVWSNDDIIFDSCVIRKNVARTQSGGGIYHNNNEMYFKGNNLITLNDAGAAGAGIFVDEDADDIYAKDKLVVKDNIGANLYLEDDKLVVNGVLSSESEIGVSLAWETGVFTEDYTRSGNTAEPNTIFFSDEDYDVYKKGNEAALQYIEPEEDAHPFVSRDDNIVDSDKVNGKNWMSAVSGERYINEINFNRAHDAVMNNVDANFSSSRVAWGLTNGALAGGIVGLGFVLFASLTGVGFVGLMSAGVFLLVTSSISGILAGLMVHKTKTNARTQIRYVDDMMLDGVREFDLRLNNKSYKDNDPGIDDGVNIYHVHGKNVKGGTYHGCDHDGNAITFNKMLEWSKEFLKNHPTETLIFSFSVEAQDAEKNGPIIKDRMKNIIRKFSREINPSTGKPYIYMPDGVFNAVYTMPKLKDCRGQILLSQIEGESNYPAFVWDERFSVTQSSSVNTPKQRVEQTMDSLRRNPPPLVLTDALVHRNFESGYFVNTTDNDDKLFKTRAPLDLADEVYFGDGSGEYVGLMTDESPFTQKDGIFFGRFSSDGITRSITKTIWSSNFYDGLQYRHITVKSGLPGDETVKTYKVLKGTKITIPDCIYDNPSVTGDGYFQYWSVKTGNNGSREPDYAIQDDNIRKDWLMSHSYLEPIENAILLDADSTSSLYPNDVLCVMDDIEVTAVWGSDINTPVEIVWNDAENADGIRPDALKLTFTNVGDEELQQSSVHNDNWKTTINGDTQLASLKPVWDQINTSELYPFGDETNGYRYEVTGEKGKGFTVTMHHRPQGTVTAAGMVSWDDSDNVSGARPDSVTLHLYKNDTEINSTTASAEGSWLYAFGDVLEKYEADEQGIWRENIYTVVEDSIANYSIQIDGFMITNSYDPPEAEGVAVQVVWKDAFDAAGKRPSTVTLLLKDGDEKVSSAIIGSDAKSDKVLYYFDTEKYESEHPNQTFNYSVEIEGLPDTYTSGTEQDENGTWIITNELIKDDDYFQGHSLSLAGDIGVNFYLEMTPEEAQNAQVHFEWFNKKLDVTVTADHYDAATGYYKVSCPVAVAEMSYDITATLLIDGAEVEKDRYSVVKYANVILTDKAVYNSFIAARTAELGSRDLAEEKHLQLRELVVTMLDYGAMAQLAFDRDPGNLANGLDCSMYDDVITSDMIDSESSDMEKGLEEYGLEYQYSTVVYLSKTSLRHYYTISDETLFDAVKDSITFEGVPVTPVKRGDTMFFEHQNIAASKLDYQFTLQIGESEYKYSVMDYTKRLLDSNNDEKYINLAMATYRFCEAANVYFGD